MTLASLVKTKANRVLGIDASTNSVAFCLMENDKPLKWGKINLVGADIYEKIYNAVAVLTVTFNINYKRIMK